MPTSEGVGAAGIRSPERKWDLEAEGPLQGGVSISGKRLRTPPPGLIAVNSPLHCTTSGRNTKRRVWKTVDYQQMQCLNEKLASTRNTVKFPSRWGRE